MKSTKRELNFAKEHFQEVHHTTLNPEGPGVVRIHLIPPAIRNDEIGRLVDGFNLFAEKLQTIVSSVMKSKNRL